jgi:hypothetical protein
MDHDLEMSLEGLMNDLAERAAELAVFEHCVDANWTPWDTQEANRLERRVDTARENLTVFVTDLLPPY